MDTAADAPCYRGYIPLQLRLDISSFMHAQQNLTMGNHQDASVA